MNNNKQRSSNTDKDESDFEDTDQDENTDFKPDTVIPSDEQIDLDYNDYLDIASRADDPYNGNVLTRDEFIVVNYADTPIEKKNLGFVPNLPVSLPRTRNSVMARNIVDAAGQVWGNVPKAQKEAMSKKLLNVVVQQAQKMGDHFVDLPPTPPGSGGPNFGANSFDFKRLNLNPKPVEMRLNTGLEPNTYGKYQMDADANTAPLHLSLCKIRLTYINSTDKLYSWFTNVLTQDFQILAQRAVNFNVNADTTFSSTNLLNYLEAVNYGLQVFYFYASIIAYTDVPSNHNNGMRALRAMLTAQDLDDIYTLQRNLQIAPIPPNLNHLIFYLSQTFSESSDSNSALLRLMPFPFASTLAANLQFSAMTTGNVATALAGINNASYLATRNLMARVVPSWISEELLTPSAYPIHDPEFTTIFANLPSTVDVGGTSYKNPAAVDAITPLIYNSYVDINKLDGAVQALVTAFDGTNWLPGLVDGNSARSVYSTTRSTTRISYTCDSTGANPGFYPSTIFAALAWSRPETYTTITGTAVPFQKFGTQPALNVSINSVRESAYKLTEWLLSFNTIQSAKSKFDGKSPSKGRGRSNDKRKSFKSKDKTSEDMTQ